MKSFRLSFQNLFILLLPALVVFSPAAFAQEQEQHAPEFRVSPSDHPARETQFVPGDHEQQPDAEASWYVRTGARKGLSGQAETNEERFVAADVAVLDRGFSASWQTLLTGEQEPAALVGPDDIAGLSATKPLLIIPSGGLSGTAGSAFFKQALNEYVRSGGTLFCLTQRAGRDYSVLPVPDKQQLAGKGWSEDSGPLFKASRIQSSSPLLSGVSGTVPSLETDGYLTGYPAGSQVLLARSDGHPTALLYPLGKGYVIVTTLFTDFSSLLGPVAADEKGFVHGLLSWIRSDERKFQASEPPAHAVQPGSAENPAAAAHPPLLVQSDAERRGNRLLLSLKIPNDAWLQGQMLLVRAGPQEQTVVPEKNKGRIIPVSLDLPLPGAAHRISYAVTLPDGRTIARSSLPVPAEPGSGFSAPARCFSPGERVPIRASGTGSGELKLLGPGFSDSRLIGDNGTMTVTLPARLPEGSYPVHWWLLDIRGNRREGDFSIDVCGNRVAFENVSLETRGDSARPTATALFRISADRNIPGRLQVFLRSGPNLTPVAEPVLSISPGVQTVPVSFPFAPAGGMGELIYRFAAMRAEGPGAPQEPAPIASGGLLFDSGNADVLAVAPEKNFYYEAEGPVRIKATVAGSGRTVLVARLDGQEVIRDTVEFQGVKSWNVTLPKIEAGTHRIAIAAENNGRTSLKEYSLTYGLSLPDLTVRIAAAQPAEAGPGPVLPVSVTVANLGKNRSAATQVRLFEADSPAQELIGTVAIPALGPHQQHAAVVDWPLWNKSGKRSLSASIETVQARESNRGNNTAAMTVAVPDLLLVAAPAKSAFTSAEPVSVGVSAFNLTNRAYTGLKLDLSLLDPAKKIVGSRTFTVPILAARSAQRTEYAFTLKSPEAGEYSFSAGLTATGPLASASAPVAVLPTLLLAGNLQGTGTVAFMCRPFTVRYEIRNTGNLYPSSGTAAIEVSAPGRVEKLFSHAVPFGFGIKNSMIERMELPPGPYTFRLSASAAVQQYNIRGEYTLADFPVTVKGPVEVKREKNVLPRVLVWMGREGRLVEQAVAEAIVKQAFDGEDVYYRVVDTEEAFSSLAKTGLFTAYVLLDPDQKLKTTEWLRARLDRGEGIAIIGAGDASRALAESLGFTFEDPAFKKATTVLFSDQAGLDVSGRLSISGKMLVPGKQGAQPAALYDGSGKPAALLDHSGRGKILVMPVSLSLSAYNGGMTAPYGLAFRAIALSVTAETDMPSGPVTGSVLVSSLQPGLKVKIREILPPGSSVLWTNAGGSAADNVISYQVQTGKEAERLVYLYRRPPGPAAGAPVSEVSFECNGSYVSQGKTE